MARRYLLLALVLLVSVGLAMGQPSFPTLDVRQHPRSTMLWLSPKAGQGVMEAGFFGEPGVADMHFIRFRGISKWCLPFAISLLSFTHL